MTRIVRNTIQVALLAAIAMANLFASNLFEIPHVPLCGPEELPTWAPQWLAVRDGSVFKPFCEGGDSIIWITALATVLFAGRRRLLWVLAPTLSLVALHAWFSFSDGLPHTELADGTSGVDWESVRERTSLYLAMCAVACSTYVCLWLLTWAIQRFAAKRPAFVARAATVVRYASAVVIVGGLLVGAIWTVWSFTDAYQFMKIRREAASSVADAPDRWVLLAAETGVPVPEPTGLSLSTNTLLLLAARSAGPQREVYRRHALARAQADCGHGNDCLERAAELTRAGMQSDAQAIVERLSSSCDAEHATIGADPLHSLGRALEACTKVGNATAALHAWTTAVQARDTSDDMRWGSVREVLTWIPFEAPFPPDDFVFAGLESTDVSGRGDRTGALFRGLARAGRTKEALEYFQSLDRSVSDDEEAFLPRYPSDAPIGLAASDLMKIEPVVRTRFSEAIDGYRLRRWLDSLSRQLARANDPEAALKLLPADGADGDAVETIADAFTRKAAYERALDTLDRFDKEGTQFKAARGRACVGLARSADAEPCLRALTRLDPTDRTKTLALSGLARIKAERQSEGSAMLDRAAALADGAFGPTADEETIGALAEAGRVRQARLIASTLGDDRRAAAYLLVCRRINGWSRNLGIAAANSLTWLHL